jgi:hypothetical protein
MPETALAPTFTGKRSVTDMINNINSDTLYWVFSTMPQTLAAFVGLVIAGVSFIQQRIDDIVETDSTYTEIYEDVKKYIHSGLKKILYASLCILPIDFFCLYLNGYIINVIHNPFVFIICSLLVLINVCIFGYTILYVVKILSPKFLSSTIAKLSNEYHGGSVDISDFIKHFMDFEKEVRRVTEKSLAIQEKTMNIYQMVNVLFSAGILTRQEVNRILTLNKMRNLIIHGGEIKHVEKTLDNQLIAITNKLNDISCL